MSVTLFILHQSQSGTACQLHFKRLFNKMHISFPFIGQINNRDIFYRSSMIEIKVHQALFKTGRIFILMYQWDCIIIKGYHFGRAAADKPERSHVCKTDGMISFIGRFHYFVTFYCMNDSRHKFTICIAENLAPIHAKSLN